MAAGKEAKIEKLMKEVRKKIEGFLDKNYGENHQKEDDGRYLIFEGSTPVQIVLRPWHAEDVVVECFAYVVLEPKLNTEVLQYLLRQNAILHFGAFGLTFDESIVFSYSIAGANVDENEFIASVKSVASISDYYDEKIQEIAGGMTAEEALQKGHSL